MGGYYFEQKTFKDYYDRLLKDTDIGHFTFHALRHTVVSLMLHNGGDKISVADFVGDDPATLDRYYAHLINDGRVQAANAMNSIIGFAATEIPAE